MITHPAMRILASEQSPWGVYATNLVKEFDEQARTIAEQAREIDRLRADAAEQARVLGLPTPAPSARWTA